MPQHLYDLFICHASEDKEAIVRPLANRLKNDYIEVWYDEFSLTIGDSLRQSIDLGLSRSRFGLVVLSPDFFRKKWSNWELNGLVAREMAGEQKVIIPHWHNVTRDDVVQYSPSLADLFASSTSQGIDEVVKQILRVIRPQGSPLIVARTYLIDEGLEPPVVTDEWWLDVVEASNREVPWGFTSQRRHWGRWTFPLPLEESTPQERGERLAWTAMQMAWEEAARLERITQITHPERVLEFIDKFPGLFDACWEYPHFLATYAPQLTIVEFSGPFYERFDEILSRSTEEGVERRKRNDRSGSALTTDGQAPECGEDIALRHPELGYYKPDMIAGQYVQGDLHGPPCRFYRHFDYLVWLLSDESKWLPEKIRNTLIDGMRQWGAWKALSAPEYDEAPNQDFESKSLLNVLTSDKKYDSSTLPKACIIELRQWINRARRDMDLNTGVDELLERFLNGQFIETVLLENRGTRRES